MKKHDIEEKRFITLQLRTPSALMALLNGTPMLPPFSEFHSPNCWKFKNIGRKEWAPEFDRTPAPKVFEILMGIHEDYCSET